MCPRSAGLGDTTRQVVVGLPFEVGTELSARQRRPVASSTGAAREVIGSDHRRSAVLLEVLTDILRHAEGIVKSLIESGVVSVVHLAPDAVVSEAHVNHSGGIQQDRVAYLRIRVLVLVDRCGIVQGSLTKRPRRRYRAVE